MTTIRRVRGDSSKAGHDSGRNHEGAKRGGKEVEERERQGGRGDGNGQRGGGRTRETIRYDTMATAVLA